MKKSLFQRILMTLALFLGAMSAASAADRFYIDAVNIEPDETRTLAFYLENENPYFGFQGDLKLPEGLEVVTETGKPSITLSSRADNSFQIVTNTLADGSLRFGTFSTSHSAFTGHTGALLYLKVKATSEFAGGELTVKDILFIGNGDKDVEFPNISISLGIEHNDKAYIPDFKISVGEAKQISLELSNETSFTAFQMDIVLPDGLTIQDNSFRLSQRASDHTVSGKSFSDGRTRIACLSLTNTPFAGNSGALVSFTVIAHKDIAEKSEMQLKNVIFTMPNAREYTLPNSVTEIAAERALVESITLSPSEITMVADGSTSVIQATVLPTFASTKDLEWSSSAPEIASVSQAGVVTAKAPGTAVITASAIDGSGVTATCNVTVNGNPVSSVTLNRSTASLMVGENVSLSATVLPANASDKSIIWSSSDESIATVDETGIVTAIAIGSTTIKATSVSNPDISGECLITVVPTPVSSITLSQSSVSIKVGGSVKIDASVLPESATNKAIVWTVANPEIASVDENGLVTGLALGTTNLTATAADDGGASAICVVNVIPTPAESITIDTPERTSFKVGESIQLSASVLPENATYKTVTWTSSDSNIIAINSNGIATAISVGEAIITATNSAGQTSTITLTVIPTLAESLSVFPQSITLKVGESGNIAVTIAPSITTNKSVLYRSANETVATVDDNGVITGVGLGETEVVVSTLDGSSLFASIKVNVIPTPAESVAIKYDGPTSLHVGQTVQLSAIVLPEDATDKSVTWQVQSAEVLSVSPEGLLKAVGLGEAWVSATTSNGKSDHMTFNVIPTPVSSIVINPNAVSLKATEMVTLTATVMPEDATNKNITWASSNNAVASVDVYGNVTANSVGEAIVTATSTDGSNVVAECCVAVVPTPVEGITIDANGSTTLKALQTVQLTAIITPETTTDKSVSWSSSNSEIASVDENGLVTAKQVGTATISAKSGAKEATLSITVIPTIAEAIALNRTTAALKVSGTIQLTASFTPETTTDKSVTWISSNEDIATVNSEGLVTAHALGECEITATTADGSNKTASCHIRVGATPAESISVEPKGPFTLRIGETVQFSATVLPHDATDKSVSWMSQTAGVTIDANGLATAVAPVENNWISATNSAGQQDLVYITVLPTLVSSIDVAPQELSLKVNQTIKVQAVVNPVDATDKSLKWSSSNTAVATVDGNGNIIAVAMGETDITVTANDGSGVSATCKVTVVPTTVESVSVTANGSTTLKPGQTLQLDATVLPENATDKTVVWTSSDVTVATVTNSGLVTAVSVGNASIKATAGDKSAGVEITVEPIRAESLILFHTDIDLKVGEEYTLSPVITPENTTDKTLVWWSDDESIASVDSSGTVHANAIGNTVVRVSTTDGTELKAEARIYVHPTPISEVIIDYDGPTTLKVGETAKLSAKVLPESATNKNIKWLVMSPAILNISEDGLVTAVGVGTSWAGAFADNESEYPFDIVEFTVVETPVDRIDFEQEYISIRTGEQAQINAIVYPETATNKSLTWESKDSNIAVVDNNGIVTGIAPGQVDIDALAADGSGVFNTIRVIVSEISVESITISANGSTNLKDGETLQLTATVLPENATDKSVRWTSNAEYRATVDENGLVTAHSDLGVLDIYAYAGNVSDKIMLTIIETQAENIVLSSDVSEIKDKETISINAQISPVTTTNKSISWTVSDKSILKIQVCDNNVCVLTGQKPGEAYVTATTANGITQSYLVMVKPIYVQSITIPSEITVEKGTQYEFKPEIMPDDASVKQLVWESSNPSLGSFNGNVFYAHARGEVMATCRTVDGSDVFAQCNIKIETYAKSLTLNEHDLKLEEDGTFQLVATIEPIDAVDSGPIVWESSNTASVSVDKDGLISALAEGESIITTRTQYYPWASDECRIEVSKNSGIETISIDEAKVVIDGRIITVDKLISCTNVRLIDLDGRVRTFTYSGQPIQITVEQSGIYILSLGKYSLKLAVR